MEEKCAPRFYTLDEAGKALGLAASTVSRYVREARLPAVRIGGRPRVSEAALAAFCESRPVVPGIAPKVADE